MRASSHRPSGSRTAHTGRLPQAYTHPPLSRLSPGAGRGFPTEARGARSAPRSEEHTSELQSHSDLVCRLLLEKKKIQRTHPDTTRRTAVFTDPCDFCMLAGLC